MASPFSTRSDDWAKGDKKSVKQRSVRMNPVSLFCQLSPSPGGLQHVCCREKISFLMGKRAVRRGFGGDDFMGRLRVQSVNRK
jgi:hypothetical protein